MAAELSPYAAPPPALSSLELAIAQLLADGRTLAEAAAELHYSYAYVRRLEGQLRARLGVATRPQLVARLVVVGLVAVQ